MIMTKKYRSYVLWCAQIEFTWMVCDEGRKGQLSMVVWVINGCGR